MPRPQRAVPGLGWFHSVPPDPDPHPAAGMSAFYAATDPTTEEESIAVIHAAIDAGCTFLDTAAVYGPHTEVLVGKVPKNTLAPP